MKWYPQLAYNQNIWHQIWGRPVSWPTIRINMAPNSSSEGSSGNCHWLAIINRVHVHGRVHGCATLEWGTWYTVGYKLGCQSVSPAPENGANSTWVEAMPPNALVMRHWPGLWRWGCLVAWFCYLLIAKPGNKTAAPPLPGPHAVHKLSQPWGWFNIQMLS